MKNTKCIHSKMADKIIERRCGWDTIWQIDLMEIDIDDVSHRVDLQDDNDFVTLREDNLFVAAIKMRNKKKMSILFTINTATKKPQCIYFSHHVTTGEDKFVLCSNKTHYFHGYLFNIHINKSHLMISIIFS